METAILILVIVAALFAMQVYLRRGMQGRLRTATSSIGEQYDPSATNSTFSTTHVSNMLTTVATGDPVTVEKHDCPQGYFFDQPYPNPFCEYWNETVSTKNTTIETIYDNTIKTGSETVGAL
jgi:hypothetical protein